MSEKSYQAVESPALSKYGQKRYVIVNIDTGETLDDAQGYGYKTPQKAYAAYAYKTRDKSKDTEIRERHSILRQWAKDNKQFVSLMDQIAFEIAKGSWGPDDVFDAKMVRTLLKDNGYDDLPFTAGELLKAWEKDFYHKELKSDKKKKRR